MSVQKKPGRPFGTTKGRKKIQTTISRENYAWLISKKPKKMGHIFDELINMERVREADHGDTA